MATEEIAIGCDTRNYSCWFGGQVAMDMGLFSGTRLRKLEIKNHCIEDESPFHGCENLETLKLIGVSISDETIANIIRVCGLLEKLAMMHCGRLKEVKIDGNTKLKRLEVKDLSLRKFHVHADRLEFLSINFSERFSWHDFLINCPNLRNLTLHCGRESFHLPTPSNSRVFTGGIKYRWGTKSNGAQIPFHVQLAIDIVSHIGDIGEMDSHLLESILPHCNIEQLMHIEDCSKERDLSPVTDKLWKNFFECQFGSESTRAEIGRMKQKNVSFQWRDLYEAEKKSVEDAEQKSSERIRKTFRCFYCQHEEQYHEEGKNRFFEQLRG